MVGSRPGGLRESPEEFAEHFGMRADVEGFRDGTATAVPAKEPCARAGHSYGEELYPVLACKDLSDIADVLTPRLSLRRLNDASSELAKKSWFCLSTPTEVSTKKSCEGSAFTSMNNSAYPNSAREEGLLALADATAAAL